MADLMTHALVAFSAATVLSWKFDRLKGYITAAMLGSVLPDLTRIGILIDPALIERSLRIPFSWQPLHTLGGVIISILIITTMVQKEHVKPALLLLSLGAATHLFLDSLLIKASGYSYPIFFPFTTYRPPTPSLYMSPDVWPVIAAFFIALTVWTINSHNLEES